MGTPPPTLAIDSTRYLAKTTQTGNACRLCEFVIRRKAYFCVLFHIRDLSSRVQRLQRDAFASYVKNIKHQLKVLTHNVEAEQQKLDVRHILWRNNL